MDSRAELVKLIRRSQTLISILLFIGVFLFSWFVTGFEITEIQISVWGKTGSVVESVWNNVICLLSFSIFLNAFLYINNNNRITNKKLSYLMFGFVSICLFMIGFFNVDYLFIHNLSAYLFFFSYPLTIFIFAYLNRKNLQYNEWLKHLLISICMITIPLFFLMNFNGMALAEMSHILFVVLWNIKISLR